MNFKKYLWISAAVPVSERTEQAKLADASSRDANTLQKNTSNLDTENSFLKEFLPLSKALSVT